MSHNQLSATIHYPTIKFYWREIRVSKMLAASARVPPLHLRTARSRLPSVQYRVQDIEKGPVKQRKQWSEEAMACAIEAVQSGECSTRRATEQNNVPRYEVKYTQDKFSINALCIPYIPCIDLLGKLSHVPKKKAIYIIIYIIYVLYSYLYNVAYAMGCIVMAVCEFHYQ